MTPVSQNENIPELLSDGREGKINENIDFKCLSNRATILETLYVIN